MGHSGSFAPTNAHQSAGKIIDNEYLAITWIGLLTTEVPVPLSGPVTSLLAGEFVAMCKHTMEHSCHGRA